MADALALEPQIEKLAQNLAKARDVLYLGRGTSFPIALEGALKLKEISYIHAEGYAAGELKHGPIALIDETMPVIVIAPYDRVFEKTVSNMQEVAARGGKIILVTDPQRRERGGNRIRRNPDLARHGLDRNAAGLCHPGAVDCLSYGRRHRHRCRPAAQSREIGHGGIRLAACPKPQTDPSDAIDRRRRRSVTSPHTSVAGRMRNYFLTGLVVAGPLAITVWLIWSFVTWVDDLMRPFIPPAYRPETYLPWPIPGTGLIIALRRADAARLPHRQPGRPHAGRLRRGPAQPHADRAADLQDHEADLRDAVLQDRLELPQGGAGRISGARHVVAGVPVAAAERRTSPRSCRRATTCRPSCRARRTRPPASSSMCKRKDLIELDISVENAMTLLISAGMVQPEERGSRKNLAALADQARKARARQAQRSEAAEVIRAGADQSDRFVVLRTDRAGAAALRRASADSVGSRDRISAASSRAAPDICRAPRAARSESRASRSGACRARRLRRAGADPPRRCGSRPRSRA